LVAPHRLRQTSLRSRQQLREHREVGAAGGAKLERSVHVNADHVTARRQPQLPLAGEEHLGLGILIDQLGTYMVLSTLGILIAVTYASGDASPAAIARKIVKFPPFQAVLLALALKPLEYPDGLEIVLGKLGATLAPLALVSVGYQLRLGELRGRIAALSAGLAFKLVMGPAMIMALFTGGLGAGGSAIQVTIFEAAMAPMIGASIIALEHKLDPPLVTLMVGIGIPLSFLTLPLWWYVLQGA
jgi:predicted permease